MKITTEKAGVGAAWHNWQNVANIGYFFVSGAFHLTAIHPPA
jgi:hypothetical protein